MQTLIVLALALLTSVASAALPAIVFDTTPGGAGGTLTYDGLGGPAVGTGIKFVDISGVGTPANDGITLDCVDCFLNFATGTNTLEGPPQWTWNGGGTFVLTGDVPALGLDNATLLTGSFTGTPNTPGLAGAGTSGLFLAIGIDTKDPTLTGFFGLGPDDWVFANTEIALTTLTINTTTGAFSAVPNQADLVNAVPEPSTLLLMGSGLVGLAFAAKRRYLS